MKETDKIMEVTRTQSQYVSKNKLNSATQTLSIMLSDWLTLCSKATDGQANNKKPQIDHRINLQISMDEKHYTRLLEKKRRKMKEVSTGFRNALVMRGGTHFWKTHLNSMLCTPLQQQIYSLSNRTMARSQLHHHTKLLLRVSCVMSS